MPTAAVVHSIASNFGRVISNGVYLNTTKYQAHITYETHGEAVVARDRFHAKADVLFQRPSGDIRVTLQPTLEAARQLYAAQQAAQGQGPQQRPGQPGQHPQQRGSYRDGDRSRYATPYRGSGGGNGGMYLPQPPPPPPRGYGTGAAGAAGVRPGLYQQPPSAVVAALRGGQDAADPRRSAAAVPAPAYPPGYGLPSAALLPGNMGLAYGMTPTPTQAYAAPPVDPRMQAAALDPRMQAAAAAPPQDPRAQPQDPRSLAMEAAAPSQAAVAAATVPASSAAPESGLLSGLLSGNVDLMSMLADIMPRGPPPAGPASAPAPAPQAASQQAAAAAVPSSGGELQDQLLGLLGALQGGNQ